MPVQVLLSVFANAALPQKVVLAVLIAAIPAVIVAALLALRGPGRWRALIAPVRLTAPMLGLFVGAMDAFHMGRTIQRLPFDATAKQLAPGILEVSTLIGLGALAGLVACAALCLSGLADSSRREAMARNGSTSAAP
jgi:hypothetical protein